MERLFNVVKKGYDQAEVDKYIETLEAMIKSYKEKDDSIKNAIINAQVAADNIIKNAEIEAEKIKVRAIKALNEIQNSVATQKVIVRDFQEEYNRLTNKYLHTIGDSEINTIFAKVAELESFIENVNHANDTMGMLTAVKRADSLPLEVVFDANKKEPFPIIPAEQPKTPVHAPPIEVAAVPSPSPTPSPQAVSTDAPATKADSTNEEPATPSIPSLDALAAIPIMPQNPKTEPPKEAPATEKITPEHDPSPDPEEKGRLDLMNDLFGNAPAEPLNMDEQRKKRKR